MYIPSIKDLFVREAVAGRFMEIFEYTWLVTLVDGLEGCIHCYGTTETLCFFDGFWCTTDNLN